MNTPALSLLSLDPSPCVVTRAGASVAAGFPSPADDYLEDRIDLNHELVRNPTATFLARVRGASMRDAGLEDGDLVVIDRSRSPRSGATVLAYVDGGFTVKRLILKDGRCWLRAANPAFADRELRDDQEDARIWGVVTHIIKSCA
jgi:DNA polymerase V